MSAMSIKNLEKSYKGKKVLQNISLSIPTQTCYSLLGINGAGKSTLMKIMTGIVVRYQGEIYFKDQLITRSDLHHIGSLIEGPAFYGNLTAFENLKLVCLQEQLNQLLISPTLEQVGLSITNRDKVKNYSLGMKQRLGIAMALLKNPDLLVLDEPFNGLDPYGVEEIKRFLKELILNGKTVIISSHILAELENITDKVGIIHQGKIVYEETYSSAENLKDIFFKYTKD